MRSFDKCRVNATNTLESIADEHELVVYDHDDDGAGEAQSGQRDEQGEQRETGNGICCPEDLYYGIAERSAPQTGNGDERGDGTGDEHGRAQQHEVLGCRLEQVVGVRGHV